MTSKDSHHHGNLSCSFCGKGQREVRRLIAGPTVYICDQCIGACNEIIAELDRKEKYPDAPPPLGRRLRWWWSHTKWNWFLWRTGLLKLGRGKRGP